jgi:hypothetical protein
VSEWAQAFGALGAVAIGAFGGANWRLPFLESYRFLGLGLGFLAWVLAGFGVEGGEKPSWYEPLGASAMIVAGVAGAWRGMQWYSRKDPDGGDDAPVLAADAARLLRNYFKWDDLSALDKAVTDFRTAVRETVGSRPHLRHRTDLIKALRVRYERLRNRADLDEAVQLGRGAQHERGLKSHRALLLTELSTALRLRYDHAGAARDLDEAKELGEASTALLRKRHRLFPLCCSRLSTVSHSLYEHTGDLGHLDAALARLRAGIDSASGRGYRRTADEIRLCYLLTQRGRRSGNQEDLNEAVATGRRTLERIGAGDALYASCLHHLSVALRVAQELSTHAPTGEEPSMAPARRRSYQIRGSGSRLEEAEYLARQAVLRVEAEAPEGALYRINHSLTLHDLLRESPNPGRLKKALETARSPAEHPTADVPTRLRAGLVWSGIASAEGLHAEAVQALEGAIGLLPRLAPHELERPDQEQQLGRWPGLAVAAATSALEAGNPDKAATLLEHGRGVLLSRTLDLRTDVSALKAAHPRHAEKLEGLRRELARELQAAAVGADLDVLRRTRREQEGHWDDLLRRIRAEPGFEDFATVPAADRLRAQSTEGPVIYLNVTAVRSDAIIVTPDRIRTVGLDVTPAEVDEQTRLLHSSLGPDAVHKPDAQGPAFSVLGWMWDVLVAPALSVALPEPALGAPLPRVWWVPTGPLSALPLHAAGHHRDGGPALIDRAVSSYTPTVRALAAARSRAGW